MGCASELAKKYATQQPVIIGRQHTSQSEATLIDKVWNKSHIYKDLTPQTDESWWKSPIVMQAIRLTALWPWNIKEFLHEQLCKDLKNIHCNAADKSYIDLVTDHFPEQDNAQYTLFVLLTKDNKLRENINRPRQGHQMAIGYEDIGKFLYKEINQSLRKYVSKDNINQQFAAIRSMKTLKEENKLFNQMIKMACDDKMDDNVKQAFCSALNAVHHIMKPALTNAQKIYEKRNIERMHIKSENSNTSGMSTSRG